MPSAAVLLLTSRGQCGDVFSQCGNVPAVQHTNASRVVPSKKDAAVRRKELLEVVSPPLLQHLCDNAVTMVMDKATSVTVSDILASACGDLRPAMTAVAQLANQELVPGGSDGQVCTTQPRVFRKNKN